MVMTWKRRRLAALADRDLRLFFAGAAVSMLGSATASVATPFALLDSGGDEAELGYVMAARIIPMVVFLLVGGVVADRIGPRRVMVASEILRCATQAALAGALLLGRPGVWTFVVLVALWGVGEAFSNPAQASLIPRIARGDMLRDANALAGLAQSTSTVAGPALAGVAVATLGSGVVIAFDAVTYAVGAVCLALLRVEDRSAAPVAGAEATPMWAALRQGWARFRSHTWLWVTTAQFTLFNLLVWAPFLVLGPVVAHQRPGGAREWGLVMTLYGAGAVVGGLASMGGRTPRRPLVVATVASVGWALPSAALAAGLPTTPVAGAALVAGVGSAVCAVLYATTNQRHLPPEVLARVTSITTLGAFALGPLGLAAAGPVASAVGVAAVLGFGAVWQVATSAFVLAVPAVRRLESHGSREEDLTAART
ncbi:MFS transporter [Microtetraspora sp. AC03309]|uniref:MFS transporter n=1 Tax=Microtetraspora sp. AC03309 TaxID=2779376 RepID=UPI001E5DCEEE|nr:MFS transporter [Microtetraspora sp. AC03309]MCC5574743.1 MFS transporter [Microtetraspora sp. AC03309]